MYYILHMYCMSVVGSNMLHTRLSVDDVSIRILRTGSSPGAGPWAGAGVLKSIRILGWVDPMCSKVAVSVCVPHDRMLSAISINQSITVLIQFLTL